MVTIVEVQLMVILLLSKAGTGVVLGVCWRPSSLRGGEPQSFSEFRAGRSYPSVETLGGFGGFGFVHLFIVPASGPRCFGSLVMNFWDELRSVRSSGLTAPSEDLATSTSSSTSSTLR